MPGAAVLSTTGQPSSAAARHAPTPRRRRHAGPGSGCRTPRAGRAARPGVERRAASLETSASGRGRSTASCRWRSASSPLRKPSSTGTPAARSRSAAASSTPAASPASTTTGWPTWPRRRRARRRGRTMSPSYSGTRSTARAVTPTAGSAARVGQAAGRTARGCRPHRPRRRAGCRPRGPSSSRAAERGAGSRSPAARTARRAGGRGRRPGCARPPSRGRWPGHRRGAGRRGEASRARVSASSARSSTRWPATSSASASHAAEPPATAPEWAATMAEPRGEWPTGSSTTSMPASRARRSDQRSRSPPRIVSSTSASTRVSVCVDDVVDVVGRGGDQLLARRHGEVEAEPQPGAQQRREDRARVGDQRDRADRQVVALGVAHRPQAAADVPEAHAAGADQRHPGVGRDPPELVADAVRVRAAEDHRAARADLRRRGELVDEPGVADAEQHQVGRLVEGVEVGQAGPAGHLVVRRVDQPDPLEPGRAQHLVDHPLAEAARARAGADERDAARLQGPREGVAQAGPPQPARLRSRCRMDLRSPDRGLGRLPAGDAADAAAPVGGGAAVVEAGDRRAVVGVAGRGPHVEQLLGRQLAVEDVAADQAVLLLHLVRTHDVAVGDRGGEPGRDLVVEVDQPVGVRLELLGVRRLAPLVRDVLGEQREDVRAVGVHRLVERGRDDAVAEGQQRGPALAGVLEGALDELHGRRHLHRAGVVLGDAARSLGSAVKLGSSASARLILTTPERVFQRSMSATKSSGSSVRGRWSRKAIFGCRRGDDGRRGELFAVLEHDAGDAAVAGGHRLDACVGADLGAELRADFAIAAETAPMPPSG